jgi:hypothetical protein
MKKRFAIASVLVLIASLVFASGGAEKSATKVLKIGATPVPPAECQDSPAQAGGAMDFRRAAS